VLKGGLVLKDEIDTHIRMLPRDYRLMIGAALANRKEALSFNQSCRISKNQYQYIPAEKSFCGNRFALFAHEGSAR
jgi:hypothetical protein